MRPWPEIDDLIPKPAQFKFGVFVEDDPVDVDRALDAGGLQRPTDSKKRKARIVLDPAQPLFVDSELYLVFIGQRDRAVVVVARDPHHQHVRALAAPRPSAALSAAAAATGRPARAARKSATAAKPACRQYSIRQADRRWPPHPAPRRPPPA